MQDRTDASLGANDLLENAYALGRMTPLPLGVVVWNPDFRQKAAGVELRKIAASILSVFTRA